MIRKEMFSGSATSQECMGQLFAVRAVSFFQGIAWTEEVAVSFFTFTFML